MKTVCCIDKWHDIGNAYFELKPLVHAKSKFNTIEIVRSSTYGKILFLNRELMHSERDEFLYHEPLIHLPMAFIKYPQTVLIFGGGDLYAIREIQKYKSVKYILMVEIDKLVVANMLSNYPEKKKILNDKRLELVYDDAYKIVGKLKGRFDLIINDALDLTLYARKRQNNIYDVMYDLLTSEGICADVIYRSIFERTTTLKTLAKLKKYSLKKFALISVPTFPGCLHLLTIWGKNKNLSRNLILPLNKEQKRWIETKTTSLNQYYDPRYLNYFFYLPHYLRNSLSFKENLFKA